MPVFDQGYQHWSGTLAGHSWRWLTIARHGVDIGMKNVFLRLLLILSWVPAAGLAFVLCVWGLIEQKSALIAPLLPFLSMFDAPMIADPMHYRVAVWTLAFDTFLNSIELYVAMLVVLLVGPALISRDLRFNALPLYFSRPLRRIDYFVGKLGVIAWFLGLVIIFPSLLAYGLGVLFSLDVTIIWDTLPLLLGCVGYGLVITLSAGTLMLALSALSRNSRYIALFWVALWFVSGFVAITLQRVEAQQRSIAWQQRQRTTRTAPLEQPVAPGDFEAQREAGQRNVNSIAQERLEAEQAASRTDWRPLVSYTGNLSRIGRQFLGTDRAWHDLSERKPPESRDAYLLENLGPQYPWYWSAGVLALLFGLSVWILHLRVRSLDRLK